MARSNKELVDLALALGAELSVPVQTDGLKNDGLEALVVSLEAQKAALPAAPAAPEPVIDPLKPPVNGDRDNESGGAPLPPAPAPLPALPKGTVSVAPGHSIVCLRGHLDAGTVVTAADFGSGDTDLNDLLARDALVKS